MNVKIEKDFVFETAVHFENKFLINFYEVTLLMEINTESQHEQNIAIERLNYFLSNFIDSSIFVNSKDEKAISNYENAGIRVLTIPEEPYDQIIGLILMLKLNSIMENRITVTDCIFTSKLCSGIKFNLSIEDTEQFIGDYWYCDPTCATKQNKLTSKKGKIVKLFDNEDFNSKGLIWKNS